jgi:hypothetical protein
MRNNLTLVIIALGVALAASRFAPGNSARPVHELLREQHRFGNGRQSRRIGLGQTSIVRRSPRRPARQSHVACLPQHLDARRQRSRPDRKRTLVQRKGTQIAANVADLHSDNANINNDTALDEQGRPINSQGAPNRHDILTGSTVDGTATAMTCQNWTSSASDQSAMLGHEDRLTFGKPGSPWNSAHPSKGCSQENLVATGGAGLIYCFAAK